MDGADIVCAMFVGMFDDGSASGHSCGACIGSYHLRRPPRPRDSARLHDHTPPKESSRLMSHTEHRSLEPSSHHSRFFWALGAWVVRNRWSAMSISLVSAVLSILLIAPEAKLPQGLAALRLSLLGRPGLIVDTSVEAFSNPDDPAQLALERYRDQFGRDDHFMVMVEGDVFSLPFLTRLEALHKRLEALNVEVATRGERKADRMKRAGKAPSEASPGGGAQEGAQGSGEGQREGAGEGAGEGFGEGFGEGSADAWGGVEGGTVIEEVTSLINARRTRAKGDGIEVGRWCDPMPTADTLAAFKAEVLADDSLVGQVVGREGRHAVLLARADFMSEDDSIMVNDAIRAVAEEFNDPAGGFKTFNAGLPEMNATLKTSLFSTMRVLLALSVLLMLGVLIFQFRHVLGVVPPLVVVGMASLNTFGFMSAAGMPVTMLSNILPAFIFCVGIGDSVHILSVYRDHFRHHHDTQRAVIETMGTTGVPVLFTSLTTIIGLLSFKFTSIPAIQEMGIAGAVGVAMACVHSLFFLPAVLTFNRTARLGVSAASWEGGEEAPHKRDWIDAFIDLCADTFAGVTLKGRDGAHVHLEATPETPAQRRRRINVLWAGVALTLITSYGALQLRVWHNPLAWLPATSPTKNTFDLMDREVGGTANVQLLIEGGARGMKDLELLKGLEALERHIQGYKHPTEGDIIGSTISVNDIVKETRRALRGGAEAEYRLAEDERELAQLLFLFENTGPDQLRRLASADLARSQMTIRLKWLEATSYLGLTDHISAGIKEHIPASAKVTPTGSVYTLVSTVGRLLIDLIYSFGTALVTITLIMIVMLKGLKLGVISMLPNLMPIIWLMGLMGFVGIPVDMNNILISSIAIGLAVDDTIHLLHHFRVYYREGGDPHVAISRALEHSGRAMLSTSVILSLGFFAYLASDMKNIQTFGMLIGLTAALAMFVDLIFTPAFVRTFYARSFDTRA
jgi:predicted RND superfamily exporter protein